MSAIENGDANGQASRHGEGARENGLAQDHGKRKRKPLFLELRSSISFVCLMAGFSLMTDIALYGLIVPVVPYRLREMGYEDVASRTGWLIAAYAGGLVLSSGPVGIMGEIWPNRKTPLLAGLVLMAAGVALFAFGQSYETMVIARILQGISGTVVWTLSLALVGDTVAQDRLGLVSGYTLLGYSLGAFLGPSVGGVLYSVGGWTAPFFFAFGLLVIDLLLRLLFIEIEDAKAYGHTPPWSADRSDEEEPKDASTMAALASLFSSPRFITVFLTTFATGFIVGGLFDAGLTLYLEERFKFDSLKAGLVFFAVVAPGFVTMPLAGHFTDKAGVKIVGAIALALAVPATAALAILAPLPGFVVLLVIQGSTQSCLEPATSIDLASLVEARPALGFAHVYSLSNLAFSLGGLAGPAAAGHVLNQFGAVRGFQLISFASAALIAVTLLPWWLYVGDKPAQLKQEPADETTPLLTEPVQSPKPKQRPPALQHRSRRGIR